ncbi:hypothetical protein [Paracoccus sp. KR1-242]|uniref:hypothetical protein n=1 Tax=Paracoccus sp. KR1-242 TaxID=3410028 RepID=UPI003C0576BD
MLMEIGTGDATPGLAERILDLLFLATTSPGNAERLLPASRWHVVMRTSHWSVRVAGPRWFMIWSGDHARLARRRVILLPRRWVGLTRAENLALAQDQLARSEPEARQLRPGLALREAQRRIGRALSRHC